MQRGLGQSLMASTGLMINPAGIERTGSMLRPTGTFEVGQVLFKKGIHSAELLTLWRGKSQVWESGSERALEHGARESWSQGKFAVGRRVDGRVQRREKMCKSASYSVKNQW